VHNQVLKNAAVSWEAAQNAHDVEFMGLFTCVKCIRVRLSECACVSRTLGTLVYAGRVLTQLLIHEKIKYLGTPEHSHCSA